MQVTMAMVIRAPVALATGEVSRRKIRFRRRLPTLTHPRRPTNWAHLMRWAPHGVHRTWTPIRIQADLTTGHGLECFIKRWHACFLAGNWALKHNDNDALMDLDFKEKVLIFYFFFQVSLCTKHLLHSKCKVISDFRLPLPYPLRTSFDKLLSRVSCHHSVVQLSSFVTSSSTFNILLFPDLFIVSDGFFSLFLSHCNFLRRQSIVLCV